MTLEEQLEVWKAQAARRRVSEKRIELLELLEDFGDGPKWGEWSCNYQLPNGEWTEGTIQADPHTLALETLKDSAGNSFDIFYP
jgi:hypothetical protein